MLWDLCVMSHSCFLGDNMAIFRALVISVSGHLVLRLMIFRATGFRATGQKKGRGRRVHVPAVRSLLLVACSLRAHGLRIK